MAKPKDNLSPHIHNRRALHDYHVLEKIECGIVLRGSEVKSIRHGQVSLAEGYARVDPNSMQLFLHDVDIAVYANASGPNSHEPAQIRKLLAHRRQIVKLLDATHEKGTTLIPLAIYFVRGKAKVELGVCTGKKAHDKRETIKNRESERELRRAMTRKTL